MKKSGKSNDNSTIRPALTVEGRENQLINLAVDLAEKQLREGTASPSVIAHYLRLGSPKARAEKELLATQIELMKAKAEVLHSARRMEELYSDAMKAFGIYRGECNDNDEDIYESD